MKPENCEVGMKVERFRDNHHNVKKGSIYTVAAVSIAGESVRLKETNDNYWYDLNLFRPVSKNPKPANKFEIGDEAVWNGKVEIWGKRYDEEMKEYEYAVVDKNNGRTLLFESELLPLKKPDELEVGDKFKSKNKEFVEVIAKENDIVNTVYYFGKTNCNKISVWNEYDVDKIIYE